MKNISLRVPVMLLCALVAPWGSVAAATDCGIATTLKGKDGVALPARKFSDGSIAVRAPLAVNPDGGAASYTVGDHGFTYIANGLARWRAGKREGCDAACSAAFKAAEAAGFKDGTDEFCVFAMEVGPIEPGRVTVPCAGGTVVGNGKGRPLPGERLKSIAGVQVQAYRSTTSLQHLVDGKPRHLDAEALPLAVSPGAELLGRVLWVGGAGMHASHALVGDAGPAFGEGSIALHQLLRAGAVTPQKPGPIPVASRCSAAETSLREPFQSRPNGGAGLLTLLPASNSPVINAGSNPTGALYDERLYKGLK